MSPAPFEYQLEENFVLFGGKREQRNKDNREKLITISFKAFLIKDEISQSMTQEIISLMY